MSRRPPHARAGARTQQTGTVLALALTPTTFQRTLMSRSTRDQALITGICGALDYGFAALIQDTVEAVALRLSGATRSDRCLADGDYRQAAWSDVTGCGPRIFLRYWPV